MTSPISAATATGATDATTGAQKPLDREAFLKLLVAQISHQDPLQPMQGTEFVTQLSQFSMVEQAISQAQSLRTVSAQIGGLASNEAAGLVGKQVTLRAQALQYDGLTAPTTSTSLSAPASKVSVDIVDAKGNVVRTLDLGARPAGPTAISWDGKDASGQTVARGTYSVKVHATAADGSAVTTSQDTTGTVTKVTFDKGYPELTLDNGATGAVSDLVAVQK